MNKRMLVIFIALVVLVVGAVGFYALTRPADTSDSARPTPTHPATTQTDAPATENPEQSPTQDDNQPAATPGAYVDYSETAIADAEGEILLFFHAPWCPQCRSIEADIDAAGVPDGVTIIKVDYDSNQALRQQYGVTLQTTFVEVDSDGRAEQTFVAYDDPRLQAVLDEML